MQTGNTLEPSPDGQVPPVQTGVPASPTPVPSQQNGNEPATRFDAGLAPAQPEPAGSPQTYRSTLGTRALRQAVNGAGFAAREP